MNDLIKQKQKLETQLHQLENERQNLDTQISDLEHQIWEISDKIQSECRHEDTYLIDFFVECYQCAECGTILIKTS